MSKNTLEKTDFSVELPILDHGRRLPKLTGSNLETPETLFRKRSYDGYFLILRRDQRQLIRTCRRAPSHGGHRQQRGQRKHNAWPER